MRRRLALWQNTGMKVLAMILLLLASLISTSPAAETVVSNARQVTELWEGSALTARFRVGMCHDRKGKAWGVLLLRHANGQEDVYHLHGTLANNEFSLRHSSGHYLSGTLDDDGTMKGKAKLQNGLTMSLSGKRTLNAPLKVPDCAPLPSH